MIRLKPVVETAVELGEDLHVSNLRKTLRRDPFCKADECIDVVKVKDVFAVEEGEGFLVDLRAEADEFQRCHHIWLIICRSIVLGVGEDAIDDSMVSFPIFALR